MWPRSQARPALSRRAGEACGSIPGFAWPAQTDLALITRVALVVAFPRGLGAIVAVISIVWQIHFHDRLAGINGCIVPGTLVKRPVDSLYHSVLLAARIPSEITLSPTVFARAPPTRGKDHRHVHENFHDRDVD